MDNKSLHNCLLCPLIVDTGTSVITGPPGYVEPLIKAIGTVEPDCSNRYTLPTISFTVAGTELTLESEYYVRNTFTHRLVHSCTRTAIPMSPPSPPAAYDFSPLLSEQVIYGDDGTGKNTCQLGIEALNPGLPLWIMGDPVLRKYYTIFDRGNNRVGFATARQQ